MEKNERILKNGEEIKTVDGRLAKVEGLVGSRKRNKKWMRLER